MRYLIGFRRDDFVWSWTEADDPHLALAIAYELAADRHSVKRSFIKPRAGIRYV